tara:strand:- start:1375 stop:3495 length:2121 start_codon:yes stop_codon:yes gene_type:complete
MRTSSPPISIFKGPLKGMDSREIRHADSPNLLVNIDLSNKGFWVDRPGVKFFKDPGSASKTPADQGAGFGAASSVVGLHTTRVDKKLYIIAINASPANPSKEFAQMWLSVMDSVGNYLADADLVPLFPLALTDSSTVPSTVQPEEPFNEKARYSFVNAGRFVYFCNGYGNFYELEFVGVQEVKLAVIPLVQGKFELVRSYIMGGLKPTSMEYFYDQIILTGFKKANLCPLSSVVPEDSTFKNPPSELLSVERNFLTVDPGTTLVCEPALWRSYPVEDPGGLYWVFNEDIIATAGVGIDILLFGSRRLYKIIGHGSNEPRRIKLAEISSISPRGHCYFSNYVFFVALDGCYITEGNTTKKISYEMDPLWFSTGEPETTRTVEQLLQKTAYPFHVNRRALRNVCCVNDQLKRQIMISLPANDSEVNNMVWVYNYSDLIEGTGPGKWSIWCSDEEPTFTGTSLDTLPFTENAVGAITRNNPATSPTQSNTTTNLFHWSCVTSDVFEGEQRIFVGSDLGFIYDFGNSNQDLKQTSDYTRAGVERIAAIAVPFPITISLGRIGRVDSDGRIICTDVVVRRKQLSKNHADSSTATKMSTVVRSEGEGLKHFDVSEQDVEFEDTILNSQQGVSENTKSTLNTMLLGASPDGSNAPLMNSEYFESYARVNVPDEEGRAAYVDLYALPTSEPHRLHISEVRVLGSTKGGSQREQS